MGGATCAELILSLPLRGCLFVQIVLQIRGQQDWEAQLRVNAFLVMVISLLVPVIH